MHQLYVTGLLASQCTWVFVWKAYSTAQMHNKTVANDDNTADVATSKMEMG